MTPTETETFWQEFYAARESVWSGNPNAALVRETAGLTPGTALDLGCGEGADSIWLATGGWRVTGVDVARVALDRAAAHAEAAGVSDRVTWQQHDLDVSFPEGQFDLVSASFFHSPVAPQRTAVLRKAAAAVAPGGRLLIVSHVDLPWAAERHPDVRFDSAEETLDSLALAGADWEVEVVEHVGREATDHDGNRVQVTDGIVRVRRVG